MTLPAYAMGRASFPEMYEAALVAPLFRPWVDTLLERAGLGAGERLLDIACGTGIVARVAQERLKDGGRVVGVDLSPQMLAVARSIAPQIEWREGNATALPVAHDERFDVVACQQGLQFVTDRPAAVREMRRVLAPGGRVAVATWRPIEESPFLHALNQVAERHVGAIADQRYGFGDGERLAALLHDARFRDVHVEVLSRTIRFAQGETFVRLNAMALVGMSAAASNLTTEQRSEVAERIASESLGQMAPYTDADGLAFELGTNLATGRV